MAEVEVPGVEKPAPEEKPKKKVKLSIDNATPCAVGQEVWDHDVAMAELQAGRLRRSVLTQRGWLAVANANEKRFAAKA